MFKRKPKSIWLVPYDVDRNTGEVLVREFKFKGRARAKKYAVKNGYDYMFEQTDFSMRRVPVDNCLVSGYMEKIAGNIHA